MNWYGRMWFAFHSAVINKYHTPKYFSDIHRVVWIWLHEFQSGQT